MQYPTKALTDLWQREAVRDPATAEECYRCGLKLAGLSQESIDRFMSTCQVVSSVLSAQGSRVLSDYDDSLEAIGNMQGRGYLDEL